MPPKKLKESITFLVNIGVVRHGTQSNSRLLDKAKFILKHIIQKKIFLRPKDEVGVMLMGSDCGESDTGMDNVQELCSMQIGNWDLIESIEKLQTTNQSCSWMEGIFAAVEYMKRECVDLSERKIILLSDFNEDEDIVSQFQVEDIAKALSSEGIFLIAIGERALDSTDKNCTASEALLSDVLQVKEINGQINGQYLTFEHAMSNVRFYKRPSTKPMLWRCEMKLGDFCIPIAGISKMPRKVKLPGKEDTAKMSTADNPDQRVPIKRTAEWTDSNRTIYKEEDIIRGYVYGGKAIPVSEEAKKAMTPKKNEKCYKIHGFTARKNVPMEYWLSDGTYVVVPASESAGRRFYALVQAMVEADVVAVVQKVYRPNTEANMVALFPSVGVPNEPWSLIEIGLPFERDYEPIGQKPLDYLMKRLSKEQSNAVDDLLVSLELSDATDDIDKYLPECMPDPGAQHMWDTLSARALNKPLPPIADEVKALLEPPERVREKCKPVVEKIKDLFFLEKKEPLKTRKRKRAREQEDNEQSGNGNVAQSIKDQEEDVGFDNGDKSNNPACSGACDFDFDDMDD
ncbi:X-ray repair cross-complementing protein 5-like [Ooceraea biroi]|uniref:X-ray repair cross-complementing protein 5-like n=1 Tax=Ooceraea biroi TaxID=2015173 RepID=UPI0005BB2FE3|nr:X-ray repair cross-complementing protein 5-like [Ooceraea biroi]